MGQAQLCYTWKWSVTWSRQASPWPRLPWVRWVCLALLYLEKVGYLEQAGQPLAPPPLSQVGVAQLQQEPGTLGFTEVGHHLLPSLKDFFPSFISY